MQIDIEFNSGAALPMDAIPELSQVAEREDRMYKAQRRKLLLAIGATVLVGPFDAIAQPQDRVRRIGFLGARSRSTPSNPDVYVNAFVQGMRDLGYVEGKNLVIEWRFADGKYERLPSLAAELAKLNLEVIVTHATPAVQALQRATSTIPIVSSSMGDPVASGFATSLARPGGNITGLSVITTDVSPKQIELLKSMLPALSHVAFLGSSGGLRYAAVLKSIQTSAQQLRIKVSPVDANTPQEIERGFAAMKQGHAQAVIVQANTFFIGQRRQVTELTARNRLPSMFYYREDVLAGGLMSYGQDQVEHNRRTATYVDKIFKGAKPGELPIEQPRKIHLAINLKTAKSLGITASQELLLRADEVIE